MFQNGLKLFFRKNRLLSAVCLSLLIHLFLLSPFVQTAFVMNSPKNKILKTITVINDSQSFKQIIKTDNEENKETKDEKFISSKSVKSEGKLTEKDGLNVVSADNELQEGENSLEKDIMKNKDNDKTKDTEGKTVVSFGEEGGDQGMRKIPASFEEDDFRVGFSTDGKLVFGANWNKHTGYLSEIISNVYSSWHTSLNSSAFGTSLLSSDEVDVLLFVDKNGEIGFDSILSGSKKGYSSYEYACRQAVTYAGKVSVPPVDLLESAFSKDGKFYMSIRFVYINPSEYKNYRK